MVGSLSENCAFAGNTNMKRKEKQMSVQKENLVCGPGKGTDIVTELLKILMVIVFHKKCKNKLK